MNVEIVIDAGREQNRYFVRANPMFRVGEITFERGQWVFHHFPHADKLSADDQKLLVAKTRQQCTVLTVKDRLKK